MNNVFFVRRLNAVYQLIEDGKRFLDWKRAGKRFPFHVFHHQVVGADVEQMTDVGVIERGDGPGFRAEALRKLRAGALYGDLPVHAQVARPKHLAHSARANWREDLVRTELGARDQS